MRAHDRISTMGPPSSPEEYSLGKWISVQRLAHKKGQLYPERLAKLGELLPDWGVVKKPAMKSGSASGPNGNQHPRGVDGPTRGILPPPDRSLRVLRICRCEETSA
ncbi:helicase associated domain-containing protein [Pseudarthrobacter sp. NS4]|uniref:helicase associated domain-containing protein n=1 Tax=Pseudarthrobacter sp. NS4 TaxID=2973976 RepID=UPI0037C61E73